MFGLSFASLRLLRFITFKVHDVLSNQAFRVVIVSCPYRKLNPAVKPARIGQCLRAMIDLCKLMWCSFAKTSGRGAELEAEILVLRLSFPKILSDQFAGRGRIRA